MAGAAAGMAISCGAAERAGGGSCGRRGPRDAISLDELHHELGQTPKAARGDLRRFDARGEAQRCKARRGEVSLGVGGLGLAELGLAGGATPQRGGFGFDGVAGATAGMCISLQPPATRAVAPATATATAAATATATAPLAAPTLVPESAGMGVGAPPLGMLAGTAGSSGWLLGGGDSGCSSGGCGSGGCGSGGCGGAAAAAAGQTSAGAVTITVPNWTVAGLIGKKGARIAEIERLSGARVSIAPEDGRPERAVTLSGAAERRLAAYTLICNQLSSWPAGEARQSPHR